MLSGLPAPVLLDIAIFFTGLSWGIGFYLVGIHLCFARNWLFCVPVRVQCRELGCACLGGRCRPSSFGSAATLVCITKATKNGISLRVDLGNLHRFPHTSQFVVSLRFPDSPVETAFVR
jgi:hypothetical protein